MHLVLQRLDQRVSEEDGEVHGGDRDGLGGTAGVAVR